MIYAILYSVFKRNDMKRGINIDWTDPNLTGMVCPPCNDIPNVSYPDVLDEQALKEMEDHIRDGWRLKSDFVRLIQEVRRLNE